MKTKTTTIKQKVTIPATPEEIYEAFTDPKKHSKFTGSKATGKPEVGEEFTAWDGYISGKYLELEEGKKIVQEWVNTDWPEGLPPSKFELTFKATEEGTEISMVQSNIPADQEKELLDGWTEFYWDPLKEYFSKKPQKKK
jgi:activator of HSP90 ATPase